MKIYTKSEIEQAIDIPYLMQEIEIGLRLASKGRAINAPVSFLHFDSPRGDVHIKSGAFFDGEMYVVKIASGFYGNPLRSGTHITAVGADDTRKQELDETVFACADLIVVDSLAQCSSYGDLSHAKNVDPESVIELGKWLEDPRIRDPNWITVADLTGLAIEDLQIAKAIYTRLT